LFNDAVADSLTTIETRKKIPGVYSVRVGITFVDATSGEKKHLYTDAVQITVTAEHIAEAEKFINTRLP